MYWLKTATGNEQTGGKKETTACPGVVQMSPPSSLNRLLPGEAI